MNNRNLKTSSLTEAAMMTGILVIIAFISQFLLSFLMFFYSMPAIILSKRKGLKYGTMSLISAGLIISMLLGIQTGIMYLILYTPLAVALSYGAVKDEDPYKTVIYGALIFIVSFAIIMLVMQSVMGVNYIQQMIKMYNESFNISRELIAKTGGNLNSAQYQQMMDNVNTMSESMNLMITQMFPALLIAAGVVISFINYAATCKIAKRFKIYLREITNFASFSFPQSFAIAMAALLITSFLLKYLNLNVQAIQLNIIMICYMAILVQGFAVLQFYLLKWNISKTLRIVIIVFVVFNPAISQVLTILGLIDLILDLRKLRNKLV
ncbi:MAG: conserved rane protein of unknown function [Bacillota bacterium]|jgi:uncharacterized protein YybS (DUF2232 family)|nr:conserved rane protein of unknown function [Bacillota bacterium]